MNEQDTNVALILEADELTRMRAELVQERQDLGLERAKLSGVAKGKVTRRISAVKAGIAEADRLLATLPAPPVDPAEVVKAAILDVEAVRDKGSAHIALAKQKLERGFTAFLGTSNDAAALVEAEHGVRVCADIMGILERVTDAVTMAQVIQEIKEYLDDDRHRDPLRPYDRPTDLVVKAGRIQFHERMPWGIQWAQRKLQDALPGVESWEAVEAWKAEQTGDGGDG